MAAGLARAGYDDVRELPCADGGEGTLDALLAALGGARRQTRVTGPLGDPVDATWGVLPGAARGRSRWRRRAVWRWSRGGTIHYGRRTRGRAS